MILFVTPQCCSLMQLLYENTSFNFHLSLFIKLYASYSAWLSLARIPVFSYCFVFPLTEPTFSFGRAGVECYCQHESGAAVIQLQFLVNEVSFLIILFYSLLPVCPPLSGGSLCQFCSAGSVNINVNLMCHESLPIFKLFLMWLILYFMHCLEN